MSDLKLFKLISSQPYVDSDGTGGGGGICVSENSLNLSPGRTDTFEVLLKPLIAKYINDHTPHLKEFICLLQQGHDFKVNNAKHKPEIINGQELVTINLGKCMHGSHNVQNHWHIPYIDEVNVSIRITSSVLLTWLQMVIFILTPIFQLSGMDILNMQATEFELFLNGFMDAFSNIMNSEIERLCSSESDIENNNMKKTKDREYGNTVSVNNDENQSSSNVKIANMVSSSQDVRDKNNNDNSSDEIYETSDYPLTDMFNEHLDLLKNELIDNAKIRVPKTDRPFVNTTTTTTTTNENNMKSEKKDEKETQTNSTHWQTGDMLKNFGKQVCDNIEHLRQINKFYVKFGKPEESNDFHKEITGIYINFLKLKYYTLDDFSQLAQMLFCKFLMYQSSVSILTSLIFSMFQTMLLFLSDEISIAIAAPKKHPRSRNNTDHIQCNNNVNNINDHSAFNVDSMANILKNIKFPISNENAKVTGPNHRDNKTNMSSLVSSSDQIITPMDVIANIVGTRLKMYLLAPTDQAWINFLYEIMIKPSKNNDTSHKSDKEISSSSKTTIDKMYSIVHRVYKNFQRDFKMLDINHVAVLLPVIKTADHETRQKNVERKTERAQNLFENDHKNGKLSMLNQKIFTTYITNLPENEYEMIFHMSLATSYFAFYNRFDMHLLQWTQKFTNMLLVSNTSKQDSLTFNNINKTFKSIAANLVLTRYIDYGSFSDLLLNNKNIKVMMDLVIHICKYSGQDFKSAQSETVVTPPIATNAIATTKSTIINSTYSSCSASSSPRPTTTKDINVSKNSIITTYQDRSNIELLTSMYGHAYNDANSSSYIVKKISGGGSNNSKGKRTRKSKK